MLEQKGYPLGKTGETAEELFHINRTPGCNCDHRNSCGNSASGIEFGTGKGTFHPMRQQFPADRFDDCRVCIFARGQQNSNPFDIIDRNIYMDPDTLDKSENQPEFLFLPGQVHRTQQQHLVLVYLWNRQMGDSQKKYSRNRIHHRLKLSGTHGRLHCQRNQMGRFSSSSPHEPSQKAFGNRIGCGYRQGGNRQAGVWIFTL